MLNRVYNVSKMEHPLTAFDEAVDMEIVVIKTDGSTGINGYIFTDGENKKENHADEYNGYNTNCDCIHFGNQSRYDAWFR